MKRVSEESFYQLGRDLGGLITKERSNMKKVRIGTWGKFYEPDFGIRQVLMSFWTYECHQLRRLNSNFSINNFSLITVSQEIWFHNLVLIHWKLVRMFGFTLFTGMVAYISCLNVCVLCMFICPMTGYLEMNWFLIYLNSIDWNTVTTDRRNYTELHTFRHTCTSKK